MSKNPNSTLLESVAITAVFLTVIITLMYFIPPRGF